MSMMKFLELRARLRMMYQKFQLFIDPMAKFLLAYITFHALNSSIGYDERFTKTAIEFILSLLCAFTPSSILVLLALVLTTVHIYAASPILAILILIIFIILYCFLYRYASVYGYAAVIIPMLYSIKMPFAVPIYLGLTSNPVTVLPTVCGVIIHYILQIVKEEAVLANTGVVTFDDALLVFTRVIDKIIDNKQMILACVIFALIILVVYGIRQLKIDYSFEIAIAAGAVTSILGFLAGYLWLGISGEIGSMIIGTIASGVFVLVMLFTKRILDYTAIKNVQFEDDDYYYYVKAIPKIEVSVPNLKVKRINRHFLQEDERQGEDEYDDE